jgi:hypothetical protein
MKGIRSNAQLWGAQAASLRFSAACRRHFLIFNKRVLHFRPASCRAVHAGSLHSPEN